MCIRDRQKLGDGAPCGDRGTGRQPRLEKIEQPLAGNDTRRGLAHERIIDSIQLARQRDQLHCSTTTCAATDSRSFAAEHGPQDCPTTAELADQSGLRHECFV